MRVIIIRNMCARKKAEPEGWPLSFSFVVGVRGFEPPAPASRRQCSTRLSYTPTKPRIVAQPYRAGKARSAKNWERF